jgi:hypothetical protein
MLKISSCRRAAVLLVVFTAAACAAVGDMSSPALAASPKIKAVRYHGYEVRVPRSWPVFDLARDRRACVRFDRHAVYLGVPGPRQSCPAAPAGRTEAILISPLRGSRRELAPVSLAGAQPQGGSQLRLLRPAQGVVVTATWRSHPKLIARALGLRSLSTLVARSRLRPAPSPLASQVKAPTVASRRTSSPSAFWARRATVRRDATRAADPAPATPGAVYLGGGFDTCSTPSSSALAAWESASSYRAVGVYIGGANMACAQPNLTASWVSAESSAGWHLIPIYVGLQAPENSCGCAAMSTSTSGAGNEGTAAAQDAVSQAQSLGIGPGNPIYYDMEAYPTGGSRSAAVLSFLAAWTTELHSLHYLSGVYSSDDSGIADLVSRYASGYPEPDEIWFAAWNGQASTTDPTIPGDEWADGQRLHQYAGAHNETHGGVTMNIDSDYLDAATAAAGSAVTTAGSPPTTSGSPSIVGTVAVGQTLTERHAAWSGQPASYGYQWERCDTAGADCAPIAGATSQRYTITAADAGATLRVLETASNAAGTGGPAISAPTAVVPAAGTGAYLLHSAYGNVYNSSGATWYGSPAARGWRISDVTGLAPTADGRGYWLVTSSGQAIPYGDAIAEGSVRPAHPITGIATVR